MRNFRRNGRPPVMRRGSLGELAQIYLFNSDSVKGNHQSQVERDLAGFPPCPPTGTGERLVHRWVLSTANRAVRKGICFERWAADVVANATRAVSQIELREAWELASGERPSADLTRGDDKPRPAPLTVQDFIRRGEGATAGDFVDASPVSIGLVEAGWFQAAVQLCALFRPDEYVFCADSKKALGILGETVRTRREWEEEFRRRGEAGEPIPQLLLPNPVAMIPAPKADGSGMTLRGNNSVVAFRHAVAEMDNLPLEQQFPFWKGFGLDSVATVVFSGHHSLHVLLRVDVPDLAAWNAEVRNGLFSRVLVPLGCDAACSNPGRLTRLAGAIRNDDKVEGAEQRLLFARRGLK